MCASKCVDMCVHVGLKQVVHIVYVFTLHVQLPMKVTGKLINVELNLKTKIGKI